MTRSPRRPPVRTIAKKALPLYLSLLATNAGTLVTAGVLGHTGTAELAAHALVAAFLVPALMLVEGALRGSMPFFSEHGDAPRDLVPVLRDALWLALLLGAAAGGLPLLWCCHALATAGMAMGVGTAFRVVSGRVRAQPPHPRRRVVS